MKDLTEEEYNALGEKWTKTTPKIETNGTGFFAQRKAAFDADIPKEAIQEARRVAKAVKKHPDEYDPDCPPSSPEALAEFAFMARELRKRKTR